jgi:hypothetical protein
MYEFEKRQWQEEAGRRLAAQNALAKCQKELAELRRKESSLWSGLVRSFYLAHIRRNTYA